MASRPPLDERRGLLAMARRQWAWFATVSLFLLGALYVALPPGHWRRGSAVMGCALLAGAVLRGALGNRAGLLAVRSRRFDVAWMLLAGTAVLVLAFWVPALRPSIDR
ncbi:MAG: DUF3017 domain-containing protein [Actinomycetia bacterium]|nr:DUF3017 domain-containing protein [Actinomycetes bacterium]